MIQSKQSRHTNAFILLFLEELSVAYGAQIFSHLQSELPYCLSDSPSVYRALQEMEEKEWVKSNWKSPQTGPPRKWYSITHKGRAALHQYAEDIVQRQANLNFFLKHYAALNRTNL
ncbi:PadR family transcriptional regulator [Desulfosporosinus sp. BG]|uniref:PadR family transcriptional regulator n=1 Tax=Desulfosporosinus sp. BG TaxID=1633135 RepID=UPI00083A8AA2|nr:PadR family transcriptional regulator [Desulfosporosinus sp. BG]